MRKVFLLSGALLCAMAAQANQYFGSVSLGQLSVEVTLDDATSMATIEMTGPTSSWFAAGFGAQTMNGTYAIFANENSGNEISERTLGNHSYGTALTAEATLETYNNAGATSTYIIERPITSGNGGYSFTAQEGSIDIIVAFGPNQTPGVYHQGSRTGTTLTFTQLSTTVTKEVLKGKFMNAYPNPTTNVINVEWSEVAIKTDISIMSLDGKIVSTQSVESVKTAQVDVSALPAGTYFVMVKNEEWYSVLSFVKK